MINPFTAPACKVSVLKDAGTRLQKVVYFWYYNTSTFKQRFLVKVLSKASAKKKAKRLKGFKFRTFIGRFQVASWQ